MDKNSGAISNMRRLDRGNRWDLLNETDLVSK
jgi:hypothetical protein